MRRLAFLLLLVVAVSLGAERFRLYLTDGTYHLVREYEVLADRVRFYSVERSQWEEIPAELIDLERTEGEIEQKREAREEQIEAWQQEEAAERARRREVVRVPEETGAYLVSGDEIVAMPQADLEVIKNKKKSLLKAISPIPMIAGEKYVVIKGPYSKTVVSTATPEFYLRLFREERFGIVRLTERKGDRQVEEWKVAPVVNMVAEEHEAIEVFRREVDDGLYKVWPKQPLEPGEYAVVEFSLGEANIQVWDFSYRGEAQ